MLQLDEVNRIGTLGGVAIRHASAGDLPDIHRAFLASFSPYHWVMSQGELTDYLARLFEPRLGPFGGFLVAARGGRLLGAAAYDSGHGQENDIPWGWARLGALAVLPEARRMGIGRFLLSSCAAHARAQGAWSFFLRAPELMVAAVGLAEGMKLLRLPHLDLPLPALVGSKSRAYVINLD
jgi:GNAT superfamily N-acetyltransferase